MDDYVSFLRARLDETQAYADMFVDCADTAAEDKLAYIVLADIAAKRKILDEYEKTHTRHKKACQEYSDWLGSKPVPEPGTFTDSHDKARVELLGKIVRTLCEPFASHPEHPRRQAADEMTRLGQELDLPE